jgi:hypothetical protein
MMRNKLIVIFAVTTMVAMIQTAQASLTLAQLAAGQTLSIGDKTFSGFGYTASGLTSFDPNNIKVTATESGGIDYLTWSGNISLVSGGFATADLLLNYVVTANPGLISMIDQRYIGSVANGSLLINETATSAGAPTAHSQLSVNDGSDPNTYPGGPFDVGENDLLSIAPPQSTLHVTKDLAFVVLSNGGSITILEVEQSFHQVPEPSAMLLGSLGGGLLLVLRLRRQSQARLTAAIRRFSKIAINGMHNDDQHSDLK